MSSRAALPTEYRFPTLISPWTAARFASCCLLVLYLVAPAAAQPIPDSLSFETARRLFLENNPRLEAARARARRLAAEAGLPTVFPNPSLDAEDERPSSQQTLTIAQDVPNPFAYRALSGAAEADRRAAAAEYTEEAADLYLELRHTYLAARIGAMRLDALAAFMETVERSVEVAHVRMEEGDLGTFDVQRLDLAALTYEDVFEEARLASRSAHAALAAMISPPGRALVVDFTATDPLPTDTIALNVRALTDLALRQRAVVRAARARVEGAERSLDAASAGVWPGFSVTAGIGREVESGGTSVGPVIGLGVDLPLWNRNRTQVEAARAGLDEAAAGLEAAERMVHLEVDSAVNRLRSYRIRLNRAGGALLAGTDSLLADAVYLYQEGEVGLLELLDAVDTAREAGLLRLELLQDYLESRYELDRAAGLDTPFLAESP